MFYCQIMKLYTLGYQGLTIDEYIKHLIRFRVGHLLDVRENAWSQRPEFIKSNLRQSLTQAHIDYVHVASAGNPAAFRKTATSAEECLGLYRQYLHSNPQCLDELISYIRYGDESNRFACLTCYERKPSECHRSVLIEELLRAEPQIEVVHLPFINDPKPMSLSLHQSSFLSPLFLLGK